MEICIYCGLPFVSNTPGNLVCTCMSNGIPQNFNSFIENTNFDWTTWQANSSFEVANWTCNSLMIGNVATINLDTGEVTLTASPNDAANEFWKAVNLMCPIKKCNCDCNCNNK